MTHRETVHQLEAEFAEAMNRMYAVGNGLARLRAELDREAAGAPVPGAAAGPAPAPSAAAPQPTATGPAPAAAPSQPAAMAPAPTAPAVAAASTSPAAAALAMASGAGASDRPVVAQPVFVRPDVVRSEPWYRREGAVTRALALTGAVVTMAGVAMLLVLAAQQGWFGPVARVTAGALLGACLAAVGVRNGEAERRRGRVSAAPVALVATGAAAGYLDVVAVTSGYGWLTATTGLLLAALVAVGGLHLARRWESELLGVLLVLGAALLAPFVARDFGWVVSAFLAVLCLAGWWAGSAHTWPVLTVARVAPLAVSLVVGAVRSPTGGADAVGHLTVAVLVTLATVVTSSAAVRRDPRDVASSVAVGMVSVGLLACTAPLSEAARTTVLAMTAVALLATVTALTRPPVGPLAAHLVTTVGVAGTVAAVLAIVSGAPDRAVGTLLALLALGQVTVAGVTRSRLSLYLGGGSSVVALVAWLEHPLSVVTEQSAVDHDMTAAFVDSVLVGGLAVAGLWATGRQRGLRRDVRLAGTIIAWVVGLTASATATVAVGTLVGAAAGDAGLGFRIGHALATVTWMFAAAWLLLRGLERSRDADLTLRTGLVLSGISVAKLFLYDLSALSGLVRSAAFIVTGLLLLATGSRYAKAYERSRLDR